VSNDPLYQHYHDQEWGVPCYDEQHLFAMLLLEGVQAGLSWITVLKKRERYYQVFDNFDAEKIANYKKPKIEKLLDDPGIIRNRLKVQSMITNAQNYLKLQQQQGGFSDYIWQFVDGEPIQNHWKNHQQVPVTTVASDAMSRSLKQHGFKFVGSTICYAYMQAVGMVNDHTVDCFRHGQILHEKR
jgi:DNA-3-methyladenine glycosylase I